MHFYEVLKGGMFLNATVHSPETGHSCRLKYFIYRDRGLGTTEGKNGSIQELQFTCFNLK